MKRPISIITSFVLATVLIAVLAVPALAADSHGRGNGKWRGWFGRGPASSLTLVSGRANPGQVDPNVSVVPPGGSSQSAVVCSSDQMPGVWHDAFGGSHWISLQANCNTGLAGSADFRYSTTFSLSSTAGAWIAGRVLADDSVTIQLNGNTIFTGGSFSSPTTFSSNNSGFFTTGTNTLTFIVHNIGGPSGLDYVARIHASRSHNQSHGNSDNDNDDD